MRKLFPSFKTKGFKRGAVKKPPMRLRKENLLGPCLKAKKLETPHLIPQSLQYRLWGLNKAYLISLSPLHTWNYTLPDYVIGAFIRMFLGVFMQKGNLVTMLNFLKKVRTLSEVVSVAHSSYKIVHPSFPSTLEPKGACYSKSYLFASRPIQALLPLKTAGGWLMSFKVGDHKINKAKDRGLPFKPRRVYKVVRAVSFKGYRSGIAKKNIFFASKFLAKDSGVNAVTDLLRGARAEVRLPKQGNLAFWNLLYQQPILNYSLKYCRLSRRVRKILKNKYRYSKYYFIIAPYKRRLFTLHLWKYILKFHDERTFFLKLTSFLKNFTNPEPDSLLWSLFYTQQRLALKKLLGR